MHGGRLRLQGMEGMEGRGKQVKALNTPNLRITFRYKCVDCGTKNTTETPPEDNVLHCSRCGFPTVQVCESVKHAMRKP